MWMGDLSRCDAGRAAAIARRVAAFVVLGWCLCAAAHAQAPPVVTRLTWPPVGAQWRYEETLSGTMGSGSKSVAMTRLADQTFLDETYVATQAGAETFLFTEDGAGIAILRDGVPTLRYLDPAPFFAWPMRVGASWSLEQRHVVFRNPKVVSQHVEAAVEAYETVATPAGDVAAFRIRMQMGTVRIMRWWSPALGVTVRYVYEIRLPDGRVGGRELIMTALPRNP